MRNRHLTRWPLTAGLAAVLLTGTSSLPAHAAQGFSLATPSKSISDGSTNATGSVSFNGKYSFTISSTVWDSCPADGDGAYLSFEVGFVGSGGYVYNSLSSAFNRDANGCDNGKESNTVTRSFSSRVEYVQVFLMEGDGGSGVIKEVDYSTRKDNPFTG